MSSILLFLLIALTSTYLAEAGKILYPEDLAKALFEEYIVNYEKVYKNEEEKKINEQNANEDDRVTYGINQFTDMTAAELNNYFGLKKPDNLKKRAYNITGSAPDALDWREKGVVSGVKNQGGCGSCWAFSATGHLEGQYAKKNGKLVELSEQQLVDCVQSGGCAGGNMRYAYTYVKASGLMSESDYPYEGEEGTCRQDDSKSVLKVADYAGYAFESDDELKDLVASKGPISIGICADEDFKLYKSGIWEKSCDSLNHGVIVVGYGEEQGKPFWIIKNSWGAGWGEDGYIRILRGSNVCHLLDDATCVELA